MRAGRVATVMYLMLVKGKQNEVVYGSVSGTPWALGKIQQYVTDGQVTGGDDGFTLSAGSDEKAATAASRVSIRRRRLPLA